MKKNRQSQGKIVLFPGMVERMFAEAKELTERQHYQEANELFEKALLMGEGDELSLSVFAYSLYETKSYERAKQVCEDLLAAGPTMYFEVMELYLTICMQLRQFKQVEKIIQSLLDEALIPDEQISKFQRLKKLNADIAENQEVQFEQSDFEPDSVEFDAPAFLQLPFQQQLVQIHELTEKNIRPFVTEIKTKNRYHSKLINFDILEKYCSFIRKTYKAGDLFYRARISERNGYPIDEMSAPPAGKSSEGRANARGITCLYVASDVDTTLHEVRAGVFDFVCVGTFRLKKDITVVDLRAIAEISPFVEGLEYLDHAINKQYLEKLNTEMSKSLRRSDSTLDYVPTQYIVDFIKSIEHNDEQEYDGIEYNSTTNPGGYNLAIFNPDLFECVSVSVYDIEKLQYTSKKVL